MSPVLIGLLYLVASGLAVAGVWMLTVPFRTERGPLFIGGGLLLAALVTLTMGQISVGVAFIGLAFAASGALLGLRVSAHVVPARLALMVAAAGLATALMAIVVLHEIGHAFALADAIIQEQWKGVPDKIRDLNMQPSVLRIPLRQSFPAAVATALGGIVAVAAAISFLKLSKSPLRKSLPKLAEPTMPQIATLLVCVLLTLLFCAWPTRGTFLWLLLFAGMAHGYVATIHLKIVDVPPVLAASVGILGLSLAAAGVVMGNNIVMVTLAALVTSGGAVLARSLCASLNVSLPGLIRGIESSKSSASDETEPAPPKPAAPAITGPDPNAPIL